MKALGCTPSLPGRLLILSILVYGFMGTVTPTLAEQAPSGTLTLTEAIATALIHNPQVQAARFQLEANVSQVTRARSGLLPQLDVSETFNHTNSPLGAFGIKLNQGVVQASDFIPERLNNPDAANNWQTDVTLSWNLFDGGQTWIGWRQAQDNQSVGELGLKRSEQQVIAQAAAAYVGCLLAAENRTVVKGALETARAHLKVVEDRHRSGLAVKSDVLRAQVRIADLEQQRLQADSQEQVARAMLGAVMGQPDQDTSALNLITSFERCIPTEGDLDQWISKALANRPDIQQARIQKQISNKQIDRTKRGHWPTLAVLGNYQINTEDFSDAADNYTVGAVLKLNLYGGQRTSSQTAEARSALSRIQTFQRGLELQVRVDTQKAFYQARSTWQSIAVAQSAVNQAKEGQRIVANRYESGLLTLVSLLDAQVALQQAQTQHFKAMHDYKVARISLALASGTIDKEFQ